METILIPTTVIICQGVYKMVFGPFQLVSWDFGASNAEALKAVSKGYLAHLRMELETWKGGWHCKNEINSTIAEQNFHQLFSNTLLTQWLSYH